MKNNTAQPIHQPVMVSEVIEILEPKASGIYLDATLGDGGHSKTIFSHISKQGKLISLDQDQDSISFVEEHFTKELKQGNWIIIKTNFTNINQVVTDQKISGQISGILFDLGMSSRQLADDKRGFSFTGKGMLDLRMDQNSKIKACDLLNGLYFQELVKLFLVYGDLPFGLAKKIASLIVNEREKQPFGDQQDITRLVTISKQLKGWKKDIHPATLIWQALRIAVNDELNSLKSALNEAFKQLHQQGKIVVLSYHSLEDRIVKQYFRQLKDANQAEVSKKPLTASDQEIAANPRARSAKLRYCIKK